MTLDTSLGPREFELADEVYSLLDMGGGKVKWDSQAVQGQPGDSTQVKSAPVELHGGFGATHRIRRGNGSPSDPTHHGYAENVSAMFEGVLYPSPRITYLDMSSLASIRRGFRVGGYKNSIVGGAGSGIGADSGVGAIGGGSYNEVLQYIREYGTALYAHGGSYTFTILPDQTTPAVIEAKFHGASARARKSDVFRQGTNGLMVALGAAENAAIATNPYTSGAPTTWTTAQVARDVFTVGPGGRLFSSLGNKVYNVLPSADASLSASYLPSNGEVITDASDPVRSLIEFSSALVAGTARQARTLDPNRGYQGVPLTAESRLSASEYDGRALISNGPLLFHATTRGVQIIRPGQAPLPAGPELLHHNDTPYKGMEWGVPDFLGDWIAWPAYIPDTGDSVIFFARLRDSDEPGSGPVIWHDALFLDGRECRVARLWGGSATRGPRLFFGAGTAANPYQTGWCDLGLDGGPDPFTSSGQPATSGFIETPLDDLGLPGVTKAVERLEIPAVHNADASNYLKVQAKANHDGTLTNLVLAQSGANQERIVSEGYARVFSQVADIVSGKEIALRLTFTQASAATVAEWLMLHGTIMLYYTEIPDEVQVITTVIDAQTTDIEEAEVKAAALRALMGVAHKRQRYGPDGADRYVKVTGAQVAMVEVEGGSEKTDTRLGIHLTMREVMTS